MAQPAEWQPALELARSAPRTKQNILAAVGTLAALGRQLHRPHQEAQQVFELALSIPHHFRLGREEDALENYETLLRIVGDAVEGGNEEQRRVR